MFTPVISHQIFSYLSYHKKRILSLTHRYFKLENDKQFQVVKKYSKIICNSSCFQKDALNSLRERFEKLKVDRTFCITDLLIQDTHLSTYLSFYHLFLTY